MKETVKSYRTVYQATNSEQILTVYKHYRKYYKTSQQSENGGKQKLYETSNNKCLAALATIEKLSTLKQKEVASGVSALAACDYFVDSVKHSKCGILISAVLAAKLLQHVSSPSVQFDWAAVSCENVLSMVSTVKPSKSRDVYELSNFVIK